MRPLIIIVAILGLAFPLASHARTIYFGEDRGTGEDETPLAIHPESDAACTAFRAAIDLTCVETLEGFAPGEIAPIVLDFGPAGSATLDGHGEIWEVPAGTIDGTFPISGDQFWGVFIPPEPYEITFASPQTAFGFYATDVGDGGGQIILTLGGSGSLAVPSTMGCPSGGVLFFGVIDCDHPFTTVRFEHTDPLDGCAYDDYMVGCEGATPVGATMWGRIKALYR